jgi:hypothetical protein
VDKTKVSVIEVTTDFDNHLFEFMIDATRRLRNNIVGSLAFAPWEQYV